jgi:hypothetical protein
VQLVEGKDPTVLVLVAVVVQTGGVVTTDEVSALANAP